MSHINSKLARIEQLIAELKEEKEKLVEMKSECTHYNPYYCKPTSLTTVVNKTYCDNIEDQQYWDNYWEIVKDDNRLDVSLYFKWQLVTLTFEPSMYPSQPELKLDYLLEQFKDHVYYACYEKHVSGLFHSHILIIADPWQLKDILNNKIKRHLTPSRNMYPAIDIKPVKQTFADFMKAYNYIWDDKPDHPQYKRVHCKLPSQLAEDIDNERFAEIRATKKAIKQKKALKQLLTADETLFDKKNMLI